MQPQDFTIGNYRVIKTLGQGGMGKAYLAVHKILNRQDVVKVITGNYDTDGVLRFMQEGQAAGNIKHPNVVEVYDLSDSPMGPYIAMEYVEGKNLAEYKGQFSSLLEVLDVVGQIVQAIHYIHSKGIIHRDLKPQNIFLTKQENPLIDVNATQPEERLLVKVGDFGLAKMPGGVANNLTQSGYLMGTPPYAPPEQFLDTSKVDFNADLYSIGIILYEFLTGDLPREYAPAFELYRKGHAIEGEERLWEIKWHGAPNKPSFYNTRWQIPPALDELVLKLLQPKSENRYQSALELFRDLEAIRQGLSQGAQPASSAPAASTATTPKRGTQVLVKGRHLTPEDVMLARNPERVRSLFEKLGYSINADSFEVSANTGFNPAEVQNIEAGYFIADYGDLQLLLFEVQDTSSAAIRRLLQNLMRRGGDYFLVLAKPQINAQGEKIYRNLTLACGQRVSGTGVNSQLRLLRLQVDTGQPTRHAIDVLEAIAITQANMTAADIYAKMLKAFDIEQVTNRFYREYAKLYQQIVEQVRQNNKGVAAFNDPQEIRGFVQRLFGRIMFLYFLQKKNWLDGDVNFLTTQFRLYNGQNRNFYQELLLPLFFDTLAKREAERNHDAASGPIWTEAQVPYLNGGLFEMGTGQEYEREIYLPNALFSPDPNFTNIAEKGILEFFNGYDFTVEEDTPLEVEVALDPEMLGKVFENLLEEDERGKSGTFYTPRPIVHFITRRLLASYLSDYLAAKQVTLSAAELLPHFEVEYDDETVKPLPPRTARIIEEALGKLRALDPAVGSGAFPVGLLQDMVAMRRAVARAEKVRIEPGSGLLARWKREYISHCLYGVDIKPAAIEIAKLRLWLSLVVDLERSQLEPLPNLDYKLMVGNSLLETINGRPIFLNKLVNTQHTQITMEAGQRAEIQAEFERLRDELFEFEGTLEEKQALRRHLLELERQLVLASLDEQRESVTTRLKELLRPEKWAKLQDTAKGKKDLATLEAEQNAIDEAEKQVRQEGRRPFFLFQLHFSDVFRDKQGFDVVMGNPPYVRQEAIKELKPQLEKSYPDVYAGTADLYVYFYGRGFNLLRNNGRLGFITSNKFFRADYGKALRKFFADKVGLETVIDFGDLPIFEATAYPCIVIGTKNSSAAQVETLTITAMDAVDELDEFVAAHALKRPQSDLTAEGWNLGDDAVLKLMAKIKAAGTPLEKYVDGKFYRGITTGLNEAFVIDAATRERLIAEDPNSAEIIKPYVRGRDVGQYKVVFADLYLIFTRRGTDIKKYPAIENYLGQFRENLEPKTSPEQVKGRKPGYYNWYEIQDNTAYWQEFEKAKIIYPDISISPHFAFDTMGTFYIGNTLYAISTDDKYLLGLLNSRLLEYYYLNISSQIRGGYLRFIAIYVGQLPIAEPSVEQRGRIEALVQQLIEQGPDVAEAATWQSKIDEIVYAIYNLTEAEIAVVKG